MTEELRIECEEEVYEDVPRAVVTAIMLELKKIVAPRVKKLKAKSKWMENVTANGQRYGVTCHYDKTVCEIIITMIKQLGKPKKMKPTKDRGE